MMQPVLQEIGVTASQAQHHMVPAGGVPLGSYDVPRHLAIPDLAELPHPTSTLERNRWAAAAGTEAPSPAVRMRALRAAYAASLDDDVQRLALREVIAHFRGWCLANGHADAVVEEPVRRIAVSRPPDLARRVAVPA